MPLSIDWTKGLLTGDNGVKVDLRNVYGWGQKMGGGMDPNQFQESARQAYAKAIGMPTTTYGQQLPGWSQVSSQFSSAPLSQWSQEWAKNPWNLTSAQGTVNNLKGVVPNSAPGTGPFAQSRSFIGANADQASRSNQTNQIRTALSGLQSGTVTQTSTNYGYDPFREGNMSSMGPAPQTALSSMAGSRGEIAPVGVRSTFGNQANLPTVTAAPLATTPATSTADRMSVQQEMARRLSAGNADMANRFVNQNAINQMMQPGATTGVTGNVATTPLPGTATTIPTSGTAGTAFDPLDPATWQNDPYYQWQVQEGNRQLQRQLEAMGRSSGTTAANAYGRLNQQINAAEAQNMFNRDQAQFGREYALAQLGLGPSLSASQDYINQGNALANLLYGNSAWQAGEYGNYGNALGGLANQYTGQINPQLANYINSLTGLQGQQAQTAIQFLMAMANPLAQMSMQSGLNTGTLLNNLGGLSPQIINLLRQLGVGGMSQSTYNQIPADVWV